MNSLESSIPNSRLLNKPKLGALPEKTGKLKGLSISKKQDSPEKSDQFKTLFEKFESPQHQEMAKSKEFERLPGDREAFIKPSVAEKKLDFLYRQAQSTNDKNILDSIKKDLDHLQQNIQNEKFSAKVRQALQDKSNQVRDRINYVGEVLRILRIMQKGKSMQGYPGEVLSYKDYQLLEQIKEKHRKNEEILSVVERNLLKDKDVHKTLKAIESVKKTLRKAQARIQPLNTTESKKIAEAIKVGIGKEKQVKLVVDCKRLWMDLVTEEGSYLEILNFVGKKDFEGLDVIKEIAFMQGPQVDMLLNKTVMEDHLKNKPLQGSPMRFLVEGAGPSGLYAALQFLRSGASVSVVNDRSEIGIRNQNLVLDPKWIAQLNFLIGSKFNELFVDPKALGVLNLQRGSGVIKTRVLEDAMKARAAEISSYIEDTKSFGKKTFLNLHFEAPLRGIKSSDKGFSAIIAAANPSPEAEKFRKLAIENLAKKILSTKYAKHQPEDIIDNTTVSNKALIEATAKWEKEQAKATREQHAITFDFLACIGGANDVIRDEFLEPAVPLTYPKNYGIASWIKPKIQADFRYFSPENLNRLNIKTDNLDYPYFNRQHIEKSLRAQDLDKFLNSSNLPNYFKKKYKNFTEELLKSIEVTHLPDVESNQPIRGFNIRMFENYALVFLAASTPPFLSDLLQDLNKLILSSDPSEAQLLKNLKKEIDKKWMSSLANVFGIDSTVVKLDDEYFINVGTFDVQQKGIDVAAKLLESGESSAVIAAFGDSRTSPHFFSGSGLSTARLSIENGAEVLRNFNREQIRSKRYFVKELSTVLDQPQVKAIEKGSRFVKQNTSSERITSRYLMLKKQIAKYFEDQQEANSNSITTGWRIETKVNEKNEFNLILKDKTNKQTSLKVKINPKDGKLHAKGKKYRVFNDLLLELGLA